MNDHRLLFIGGLHRSGTTLLAETLRAHPQISGFSGTGTPMDEGQHLQSVYRPDHFYGPIGRFGFHPDARLDERSPLVSAENANRLFGEWSRHWDLTRPVLLEKSPANLIRTRFLQALFPQAHFIVVTRHPVAVSYAARRWSKTSLSSSFEYWAHCHRLFEGDLPHVGRVCVLKYEELVAEPEATLTAIFRFVGLPPHPIPAHIRTDTNNKYLSRWERLERHLFTRPYRRTLSRRFADEFQHFGYGLDVPYERQSSSWAGHVLPALGAPK